MLLSFLSNRQPKTNFLLVNDDLLFGSEGVIVEAPVVCRAEGDDVVCVGTTSFATGGDVALVGAPAFLADHTGDARSCDRLGWGESEVVFVAQPSTSNGTPATRFYTSLHLAEQGQAEDKASSILVPVGVAASFDCGFPITRLYSTFFSAFYGGDVFPSSYLSVMSLAEISAVSGTAAVAAYAVRKGWPLLPFGGQSSVALDLNRMFVAVNAPSFWRSVAIWNSADTGHRKYTDTYLNNVKEGVK